MEFSLELIARVALTLEAKQLRYSGSVLPKKVRAGNSRGQFESPLAVCGSRLLAKAWREHVEFSSLVTERPVLPNGQAFNYFARFFSIDTKGVS
jgi:hypothetical protein